MVNNQVGIVLSSFYAYKMCIYDIIFVFNITLDIKLRCVPKNMNRKITTGVPELHPISVKAPWHMLGIDL